MHLLSERSKTIDFYASAINCHFDVIILTESWLNASVFDSELFRSSDYTVYRSDRSSLNSPLSDGGGVLIAVRSNMYSERIVVPNSEILEILFVKCIIDNNIIHFCGLYIPPASNDTLYQAHIDTLEDYIGIIGTRCEETIYVIGDFNIPKMKWYPDPDNSQVLLPSGAGSGADVDFVHSLFGYGLSQLNSIANFQGNFLDLFFSSNFDDIKILQSNVPLSKVDILHYPIEIYVDLNTTQRIRNATTHKLNFRKANFDMLNIYLNSYDWKNIINNALNVNEAVNEFYQILHSGFQQFVPIKRTKSNCHPPWFNREVLHLLNVKRKCHRKYVETKSTSDYNIFSIARQKLVSAKIVAHRSYIKSIERTINNDPSKFWNYVNEKKNTTGYPSVMHLGDNKSSEIANICDFFATFFAGTYSDKPIDAIPAFKLEEQICIGSLFLSEEDIYESLLTVDVNKYCVTVPSHFQGQFSRCLICH